jgi:predicted negative regulator of RcsB-dependent stress response
MKTARRHELKENDLAHYLEQTVDWASANAKLIVLGIAGVLAVIAALAYFQHRSKEKAAAAWDQEYAAEASDDTQRLEQFVESNKGTAAGQLANLRLADIDFDEGINQMSIDRENAEKRLNDAKNRYFAVLEAASDSRIKQRAELGMARYFESIGDLDKAKEHYGRLAKIENGLFRDEADRKLADLGRPLNEEFVKWYSKLRPKARAASSNPLIQSQLDQLPNFPTGGAPAPGAGDASAASPTATGTATPKATATPTAAAPAASKPAAGAASPSAAGTPSPSATATGK